MAEAAVGKRIKISKIQQQIMLAVLGTSLVFGVSIVFVIFFIKYIAFNTSIIKAKDESISNYNAAILNAGICTTNSKDKKFSDKDLEQCHPEEIEVTTLTDTLRYNVLVNMAQNNNLESVARDSQASCYNAATKKKIDFVQEYQNAKTDKERAEKLYRLKMCSSLRVIPDALPSQKNDEALLASMNKIFLLTGFQPKSLSPSISSEVSPVAGLQVIPVSVSVENTAYDTTRLLQNLENSIRSFSFQNATITWGGEKDGFPMLDLQGSALAFYTDEILASESEKTIYASKEAKKAGANGGLSVKTVEATVKDKTGADI
jgi:hypothetical protein